MGAGQLRPQFSGDQRKRSSHAILPPNHRNKLVVFGENTTNQISYLLNPEPLPRTSQETFILKLKAVFDDGMANPVVGLATDAVDPNNVVIEENPSLFILFVRTGRVMFKGQSLQPQQEIPKAKNGAEVTLQYTPAIQRVRVTVANPGRDSLTEGIVFATDINSSSTQQLLPFVGDMRTGSSATQFHILGSRDYMDHTNNSFIDVSHKVLFTTSFGVVVISRDRRSVTRTTTQQGNGCALLPMKIATGVHRWGFTVRCDFGASLCLGLARYPFMLSEEYLRDHVKHIYRHPGLLVYRSYRGLLYVDGKQLQESLEALGWQHGKPVVIEFIFDANNGTLEVIRNNRSLGIAFRGLSGTFQPIVCFYAAYEKDVSLKHYLTTETTLEMLVQSPPSSLERMDESPAARTALTTTDSLYSIDESVGFDEALVYGSISVSEDKKTAFRDKSKSGNAVCLLNPPCSKQGAYRMSFIIEFDSGASTCIGVTEAASLDEIKIGKIGNVYASTSLCLYRSFQGMVYIKGKEQPKKLEEFWMSGTLVEMEVKIDESDECSVGFKVNDVDQGVAFSGLKAPLTCLFAFYAGMEKRVTLLHHEYTPTETTSTPTPAPTPSLTATAKHHNPPEVQVEADSGLNNVDTSLSHSKPSALPIICSSGDAAIYYPCCMKCEGRNNVIALPCKHTTICSKDLNLGINAPTKHCMICDEKVTQVWNIFEWSDT